MSQSKNVENSTERRKRLCLAIENQQNECVRPCKNCERRHLRCLLGSKSGKCSECIRSGIRCDIFLSDTDVSRLDEDVRCLREKCGIAERKLFKYAAECVMLRLQLAKAQKARSDACAAEEQRVLGSEIDETFAELDASYFSQFDASFWSSFQASSSDTAGEASGSG